MLAALHMLDPSPPEGSAAACLSPEVDNEGVAFAQTRVCIRHGVLSPAPPALESCGYRYLQLSMELSKNYLNPSGVADCPYLLQPGQCELARAI